MIDGVRVTLLEANQSVNFLFKHTRSLTLVFLTRDVDFLFCDVFSLQLPWVSAVLVPIAQRAKYSSHGRLPSIDGNGKLSPVDRNQDTRVVSGHNVRSPSLVALLEPAKHKKRTKSKTQILFLFCRYCDPTYAFPPQKEVVKFAVNLVSDAVYLQPNLLVVTGSYTIGKEKIFMGAIFTQHCLLLFQFVCFPLTFHACAGTVSMCETQPLRRS